ncbi:MAG: hypothetical protein LC775_18145, partial [Acidobacteria bacterium]|nr:hypothetical protein [Acidobacteriota bacterium]
RAPAGTTLDTGAALCFGMECRSKQPPGRGAMPNEGIQEDEWTAYVTLETYNKDVPRDCLRGALRREALCHIPSSAGRNSEETFLNLMAYSDPKGQTGDNSMPLKQWSCPGTRSGVLRDSSDMVKARLPEPQSPEDVKLASVGKVPETGAAPCIGVSRPLMQPPRGGAIPSEGI